MHLRQLEKFSIGVSVVIIVSEDEYTPSIRTAIGHVIGFAPGRLTIGDDIRVIVQTAAGSKRSITPENLMLLSET
jgi:hypothetical protein